MPKIQKIGKIDQNDQAQRKIGQTDMTDKEQRKMA